MKKTVALLLALALTASLTACGGQTAQAPSPSAKASGETKTEGEIGGEITVACYDTITHKSFLEEAAKKFEAMYPGTKVNIETFSEMPEIKTMEQDGKSVTMMTQGDDTQSKADYISKVNTELMGGGGADVLAMDVLPFHKYAENGQLENLSDYIASDRDWNDGDYRRNVLDSVKYNGNNYFIPLDYTFNYYAYDSTLLDAAAQQKLESSASFTYEQLLDAGAASFEANGGASQASKMFGFSEYGQKGTNLFTELLKENMTSFVDIPGKTANFSDGKFAALLESVKAYGAKGYLKPDMATETDPMEAMEVNKDERYYYKSKINFSLMQHFNKDTGMVMRFGGTSMGNEDEDKLAGMPANSRGEVPFSYTQGYGINANSANKLTAWAFIKFLLGKEMQTSTNLSLTSLPVRNEARMERAKMAISGALFSGIGFKGAADGAADDQGAASVELDATQQAVYEQYSAQIEAFSDQLNACPISDATIESMIQSEVKYFFDGTKTAGAVAEALQSKIDLYLHE